jgi:hypothetical protein
MSIVHRNVVLLGDSLIYRPFTEYSLTNLIEELIVYPHNYTYINEGANAQTISQIWARTPALLNQYNVGRNDFVILYWDSDVSNIDQNLYNVQQNKWLRSNYTMYLELVIEAVLAKTNHLAVAGPGLIVCAILVIFCVSFMWRLGRESILLSKMVWF